MTQSNPSTSSDELQTSMSLVRDAQAFDNDAWLRLVNIYSPLIRYWFRRRGITGQDVNDCCQDVFMGASKRLPFFQKKSRGDTFRGWLHRITYNVACDYYRDKYGEEPIVVGGTSALEAFAAVEADSSSNSLTSHLSKNERHLLARHVINIIRREFSEKQTEAFFNVVMHQRKPRDVAEELDTSVNNVYKAKCRILAKIRKLFPESNPEDSN